MTPVVHLVDDDAPLRTALTRLLRAAGYEVRAYASSGDFLLTRPEAPGCLLLDVRMPGPSGLDLQAAIASREDALPIIFMTGFGDVPTSVRAMKAGAVDFLTKPVRKEELLAAVEAALERDTVRRSAMENLHELRARHASLTPREQEVCTHVVAGLLNKQIASVLGTCERTVKAHRSRVMKKMGVGSVAELVRASERLRRGIRSAAAIPRVAPAASRAV
jgi:FixJ family two-component response regulator